LLSGHGYDALSVTGANTVNKVIQSALWGLLASVIAFAAGAVGLIAYARHLIQLQGPGGGVVVGGVLPLLIIAAVAFAGVFAWSLLRR
jgi:hypothetical protein